MKYIYGPVSSYRLGRSLGIDILSQEEKFCTFGCIYCQLGPKVRYAKERRVYVKTEEILSELAEVLPDLAIDHITFSGRGESTLAENLGEAITKIKEMQKKPVAVLTNSSLMNREDVIKDIFKIKKLFLGLKVVTVYDRKKEKTKPISPDETSKRRGDYYTLPQ